jgi:ABC-2 type transport system ATP-binding protein
VSALLPGGTFGGNRGADRSSGDGHTTCFGKAERRVGGRTHDRRPAIADALRVAAIRTRGLAKRYGSTYALRPLDLEAQAGEVLGYLGPNGAGKTTTIRCLLGLARATAGRAEIFGIDAQARPAEAHRRLAYVPGDANLWPGLTGRETLHLLGQVQGRVDRRYRDDLVERFALDPSKRVRAYSKGNRQKVLLIAALASRADLLILDEPTTGLDPLMEQTFRDCIREAAANGQTVFLSSHILSEVEALSDRVAIIRAGELVEVGTLAELRHLSALSVDATFDTAPPDLARVPGVTAVQVDGNHVRCQVVGSVEPLLAVLAASGVHQLLSREPSLEELFLVRYGREPAAARDPAGAR